ncbi:MAG: helix-turn-helix domain-containing protein [Phycisphaerales bacterium]|nr:helix-turn-helix domain-containing protein [Phycisphaerales bacterium]
MEFSPLHERLKSVVAGQSYRQLGELTGTNAETVRRYVAGQAPSVEFLSAICDKFLINGEWLLTGRGPMRRQEIRKHALQEASAAELLNAMATTLEKLTERVERLEMYLQSLETLLRADVQAERNTPGQPAADRAVQIGRAISGGAVGVTGQAANGASRSEPSGHG